ncbi:MAG: HAD family hydrolase [Candidatus Woesearchaeota archaeon]
MKIQLNIKEKNNENNNSNSKIKGILLDFDGTVVNSEQSRFRSIQQVLRKNFNIKFTQEIWERTYKSLGTELIFKLILEKNDIKTQIYSPSTLYEESKSIRTQIEEEEEVEVIRGFREFYEKCKNLELKCIICSGGTSEHVQRILKKAHLDIQGFGRDEYEKRKPSSDAWIKGLEILQLRADEVVLFDDAKTGIEAGLRAGITKCCAINYDTEDFKNIKDIEKEIGISVYKYFKNWKEVDIEKL